MLVLALGMSAAAHSGTPLKDSQLPKPSGLFGLPFAGPAGPDTWMVGQVYGNTTGAYRMRNTDYRSGQGIHFGLDLAAPCGTPVLAIGTGVVQEVDGPHGSPPHNLVIDHGNGLSSLYGHLLKKPTLKVGQRVKRGQVVAVSGDSELTCHSSQHLHLEIRDTSHMRFFNPTQYIQADWDTLYLQGAFYRGFQRDLGNMRKWQFPEDQPQVFRGGPLLNQFDLSWPPDQAQHTPQQGVFAGYQPVKIEWPGKEIRLTSGGCCVQPEFTPDSSRVMFMDRPDTKSPLGWYAVQPQGKPQALLPLGWYSPDLQQQVLPGALFMHPQHPEQEGLVHTVPAGVGEVFWAPDGSSFAWNEIEEKGTSDVWPSTLQLSSSQSSSFKPVTLYGGYAGGVRGFLDRDTLIVVGRKALQQKLQTMYTLNLHTQQTRTLETAQEIRGVSISKNGKWVAYLLSFSPHHKNGLFVVNREGRRLQVPGFGSYRWKDEDTLLLVPMKDTPQRHTVHHWTVGDPELRPLVQLSGKISNDQWVVSPDGKNLAYVQSQDHNIYGLKLPE
ncbi:hypothetical protein DC3_27910 [Deinococcus cellulosilyticus NBRC 106333 = KACC 11606]|uniref:M23ase beta-sheet core domain-containing protein n=1 Tax=Deinococcus cellulosilyticus (strain DSM 18568 / NBRC 106333 / KACC 11606 / 5516J-15) TaxID=1223518 RepID=A0A511N417_DEIC1|nr:hypothetical protein DC3_27910 [Deinococcus cellulosilyticus NBRC 106333 = KACC 11606]